MQQSSLLSQIPSDSDSSFHVIKGAFFEKDLGVVYLKQRRPRGVLLDDVLIIRKSFLFGSHIMEDKVIATGPRRKQALPLPCIVSVPGIEFI
jgi:hypothetical protein